MNSEGGTGENRSDVTPLKVQGGYQNPAGFVGKTAVN